MINIASNSIFFNNLKFCLVFIVFLLLVNYQSISIFQGIFSSAIKIFHYFRPFLGAFVLLYAFKKLNILFRLPRTFFQVRIQVAIPMLSALFSISKYFIISIVQEIKSLRDHLPIFSVLILSLETFFSYKFG